MTWSAPRAAPCAARRPARQRYEQLLRDVRTEQLVEVRRLYAEDVCVVEHECAAAVLGNFGGLPGRGRSVRFRMLHVFEFRAGLISRENVWIDTASLPPADPAPVTVPGECGSAR